jgi:uncharacterized C2H2 Zn-finger protein
MGTSDNLKNSNWIENSSFGIGSGQRASYGGYYEFRKDYTNPELLFDILRLRLKLSNIDVKITGKMSMRVPTENTDYWYFSIEEKPYLKLYFEFAGFNLKKEHIKIVEYALLEYERVIISEDNNEIEAKIREINEIKVREAATCCVFKYDSASKAGWNLDLEVVEDFGDKNSYFADGNPKRSISVCEVGKRKLLKCRRCGALFLQQENTTDYEGVASCSYIYYFSVNDRREAHLYNEHHNGSELIDSHEGYRLQRKQENTKIEWRWNKVGHITCKSPEKPTKEKREILLSGEYAYIDAEGKKRYLKDTSKKEKIKPSEEVSNIKALNAARKEREMRGETSSQKKRASVFLHIAIALCFLTLGILTTVIEGEQERLPRIILLFFSLTGTVLFTWLNRRKIKNKAAKDSNLCCSFSYHIVGEAMQNRKFETIEKLGGGDGEGYSWKDGSRELCKCKNCGALFLNYKIKFLAMTYEQDEINYSYYFPVKNREEALEYSDKYIGDTGLSELYRGKKIWFDGKKWCWNK